MEGRRRVQLDRFSNFKTSGKLHALQVAVVSLRRKVRMIGKKSVLSFGLGWEEHMSDSLNSQYPR